MGGERQEPRVVHRLVAVVTTHHNFHVVIKTGRRNSAQVLEGADVLTDGRGEVLTVNEVELPMGRGACPGRRPGDVRCSGCDSGGIEPAGFAGPGESADSAEWRSVAASAEPRPGTRDCNSELEDGWDETAFRSP